jgi:hypothetical protein
LTRPRLILLLLLGAIGSAAVGLNGCARYGDDIDAVKQADSIVPGKRNEILVIDMAGARGTVEWQGGPAPKYDSPDIVAVSAVIKRISGNGNRHQVELDFIHNRQTKQVAFDGALVDGKKQDLIGATINLFLMQLE